MEELGGRFWLGLIGIALAVGIGGFLLFLLFGAVWYSWGLLAAFVFFGAILLGIAYVYDRRQTRPYRDG